MMCFFTNKNMHLAAPLVTCHLKARENKRGKGGLSVPAIDYEGKEQVFRVTPADQ